MKFTIQTIIGDGLAEDPGDELEVDTLYELLDHWALYEAFRNDDDGWVTPGMKVVITRIE